MSDYHYNQWSRLLGGIAGAIFSKLKSILPPPRPHGPPAPTPPPSQPRQPFVMSASRGSLEVDAIEVHRRLLIVLGDFGITGQRADEIVYGLWAEFEHCGVPLTELVDGDIVLGDDLELHLRNQRLIVAS